MDALLDFLHKLLMDFVLPVFGTVAAAFVIKWLNAQVTKIANDDLRAAAEAALKELEAKFEELLRLVHAAEQVFPERETGKQKLAWVRLEMKDRGLDYIFADADVEAAVYRGTPRYDPWENPEPDGEDDEDETEGDGEGEA